MQERALEAERVVMLTQHVASALDAAHRSGIVHRDVKPGNILLTGSGADEHAYVADFGLTKEISSQTLSSAGEFLGTLAYARQNRSAAPTSTVELMCTPSAASSTSA